MKALLVAALLVFSIGAAAQEQPSLADAARQPKSGKKASRVVTNDEIPSKLEPAPEPKAADAVAASNEPAAKAKPANTDAPADAANSEAMKLAQANLDDANKKLAVAQKDVEDLQEQTDQAKDKASKDSLKALLQSKQEYRQNLKKQVADASKLLRDLEVAASDPAAPAPKGVAY